MNQINVTPYEKCSIRKMSLVSRTAIVLLYFSCNFRHPLHVFTKILTYIKLLTPCLHFPSPHSLNKPIFKQKKDKSFQYFSTIYYIFFFMNDQVNVTCSLTSPSSMKYLSCLGVATRKLQPRWTCHKWCDTLAPP